MRSLLPFVLLFSISAVLFAEVEKSEVDESLFASWKSSEKKSYENKNTFAWKQGGGYFINDFVGVEGNVYKFKYYEKFRYSSEGSGFLKPEDYTLNVLGIGKIPISKHFALFGKVGPTYYQNPLENTDAPTSSVLNTTTQDALLGLTYSTGARVLLSSSLEFSLEYMNTQNDSQALEGTMAQMNWKF